MDVISGVIPNDNGEYINIPVSWRERKHEIEAKALEEKEQQSASARSSFSSATSTGDFQPLNPGSLSKQNPVDGYMLLEDEESQSRKKPPMLFIILVQFAMFLKRGLAQQYKRPATIAFDFLLVLMLTWFIWWIMASTTKRADSSVLSLG